MLYIKKTFLKKKLTVFEESAKIHLKNHDLLFYFKNI